MSLEIRTAGWLAIAGFLWVVLEYALGMHSVRIDWHETITWFAFVPSIMIYIYHYRKLRQKHAGKLTVKKGLISGLLVTAVAIPLNVLAFTVYYYMINPNFFTAFINYTVDHKVMSRDVAASYFSMGSYALQIAVGTLFMGVLLSVVLSFIFKSKISQASS